MPEAWELTEVRRVVASASSSTRSGARRLSIAALVLFLALLQAVGWAHAEQGGIGQDDRELLGRARDALADGEFERAIALLQRALERSRDVTTRAQIQLALGVNYAVLGRSAAARRAFEEALRSDPLVDLEPSSVKGEIVEVLRQVRARLRGTLAVESTTTVGAEVAVDGTKVGEVPCRRQVPVGRHLVEVRYRGGRLALRRAVVVRANETTSLWLAAEAPPASQPTATLPPARARPRPAPEGLVGSAVPSRRLWTWVALGGAVAAGAAGLGLYFGWAAGLRDEGNAELDPRRREDLERRMNRADLVANLVGWGAGGLFALASAVLFFLEGSGGSGRVESAGLRLTSWPGQRQGLSLAGRF